MIHFEYSKIYFAAKAYQAREAIVQAFLKLKRLLSKKNRLYKVSYSWQPSEKPSDSQWLISIPNLQGNPEVTAVAQVGALEDSPDGVLLFKGSKSSLQAVTTSQGILFTEKGAEKSKTWSMSYQEVLDVLVCTKFLMDNNQLQPGEWFTNREPAYSPRVRASKTPTSAKRRRKKPVKTTAKKQRLRSK